MSNTVMSNIWGGGGELKRETVVSFMRGPLLPFLKREMLRLPLFVDSRLTDGGEVSLTRRPPFTPRNIPGTHFC
jgi:hypothetical protein